MLLPKVVENITQKEFSKSIPDLIIEPREMENTGFIQKQEIVENLAYGYHSYTFGNGDRDAPLLNDRRYLSN